MRILSDSPFSDVNKFVTTHDVESLRDGESLNDEIINSCIDLFQTQSTSNLFCRTTLLAKVFNLQENTKGSLIWEEHSTLPKKLKSPESIKKIYLPLLYQKHYTLFVADVETFTITVYDSLSGDDNHQHCEEIVSFINYWIGTSQKFTITIGESFEQKDSHNCGVYLILTLRILYENSSCHRFGSRIDLTAYRKMIKKAIVEADFEALSVSSFQC